MRRIALASLLTVASMWLIVAPAAVAQEYVGEAGDLDVTMSETPTLSGSGFAANSIVFLTLTVNVTGEVIDLGTLETDSMGAFSTSVAMPDGLEPGTSTLTATGVTPDGASRVLSANVTTAEDSGPPVLILIVGIAVLIVAIGGWWQLKRR